MSADTLEALWTIEFGDAVTGMWNGGVVVLETNRVFGGDSNYYYIGNFTANASNVEATIRVRHYSGPVSTAFGDNATDFPAVVHGTRSGNVIEGTLERPDVSSASLPLRLTRQASLP